MRRSIRELACLLLLANSGLLVAQPSAPSTASFGAKASACMDAAKAIPKTLNSVVDTRCSLVAFEVCMNKATGVISQSQDAKRQCAMVKEIGGASACLQPCAEAIGLPVGGSGAVDRYTGLTAASVSCYNATMSRIRGVNQAVDECNVNQALECLQNASSSPSVNEAILRERKSACHAFSSTFPNEGCSACSGNLPRVDYEELKKHDVLGVDVLPVK